METHDRWAVESSQVMSEILDGEAIIIDLQSGRYHASAGVGATVWRVLSANPHGAGLGDLMREIRAEYVDLPNDAEAQVRRFVDQLVSAGLAGAHRLDSKGIDDRQDPLAKPANSHPSPWEPPRLESHDDLDDLLQFDPVHDVAETGWPHLEQQK